MHIYFVIVKNNIKENKRYIENDICMKTLLENYNGNVVRFFRLPLDKLERYACSNAIIEELITMHCIDSSYR